MSPRPPSFTSRLPASADALTRYELAVARRADELARRPGGNLLTDLELWLQSEREVFAARAGLDLADEPPVKPARHRRD
jgi:hypothetical protein